MEHLGLDPLPVFREPAESRASAPEVAKEFPLLLSARARTRKFVHSQFHNIPKLKKGMPKNLAELHPSTTAGAGIVHGKAIRVETPRGAVECVAEVTPGILPGLIQLHHGFSDSNANLLADSLNLDSAAGSAPMRSGPCRVSPA